MTEKRKIPTADSYKPLLAGIVALLEESRRAAGRTINSILTSAYWEIGRRIVVEEQRGRRKANYGEQLIEQLAADLTARFGKGFSRTNVFQMRQFYQPLARQQGGDFPRNRFVRGLSLHLCVFSEFTGRPQLNFGIQAQ